MKKKKKISAIGAVPQASVLFLGFSSAGTESYKTKKS
jgi:hypothetical protein